MGLFGNLFHNEIAMDLGTANTLIMLNDQVVLNEPSIIAIDTITGELVALGRKAMEMHEKTPENIKTIRPLKDGVISNFHAAEQMIRGMIKMIFDGKKSLIKTAQKMVICIPYGATEVEKRAVRDSAENAGVKELYLIHEPIAAAVGIGIDIEEPHGSMVIDIGGGTTEIAVISLCGVVCNQSLKIAGDQLNKDILNFMRRSHNLLIGERSAERIKIEVGAALQELDDAPANFTVIGRDMMTGLPKEVTVNYAEVSSAMEKSISVIEESVIKTLETCPPELAGDIYRKGIHITGGGSNLKGLDKRLEQKTKLKIHLCENSLLSVIKGTSTSLKKIKTMKHILVR
ncbi:MAG: rod shape-determining protein [Sporocytophaga sp.]|uniref:rod shape-determining protein n=1 Tax=Sporocytophaga sp. TaxID=2231183 RepID=UPI001B2D1CDE|nr:rod shape-determining protein [Sporocytophaga sp.]MBO9701337.1 rod shape-determining protein [Sporocytophaga sp.]